MMNETVMEMTVIRMMKKVLKTKMKRSMKRTMMKMQKMKMIMR